MSILEKITRDLKVLPESAQVEVLDFVEFLKSKAATREDADWSAFSLGEAMRGLEDEPIAYSEQDLKEVFT
jgi:hypothetical protein